MAFFIVFLVVIGLGFRKTLQVGMEGDVRAALEDDWSVRHGYFRIENQRPEPIYDRDEPEENYTYSRLTHVFLVTDENGEVLQESEVYASIGIDSRAEIQRILRQGTPEFHTRSDKDGVPYLIMAGTMTDDRGKPYFLAMGRSLAVPRSTLRTLTRTYLFVLPGLVALSALLAWMVAGRAIRPLHLVANAAQNITGSNLSPKIPLRGAGDELDHLIESFNRMTERLQQSFEQTRRFSTDVSHELRTPLTAIRGQLEVALFTAETPEQYREAMVNALEDVEKLSSIVRALLLLSQAESGQLALQKTPLDVAGMAADVVEQFQIPAEEKGVTLSASLDSGAIISADRTQIERLLSNLLSNAVKYTPRGGSVRVRAEPVPPASPEDGSGWARLVVEDTGVGIPAENLPHIFDRFYRVRSVGSNSENDVVPGLGLGLSFVAWIVAAHAGRIDVASTAGEGSRFTVMLPLASTPAEAPVSESSEVGQDVA